MNKCDTCLHDGICALLESENCPEYRDRSRYVRVVRCRDCVYARERRGDEADEYAEGVLICEDAEGAEFGFKAVFADEYCSCGRRK